MAQPRVVVQHRRHDAGRAVRRCGDHAAAGGILLVDGERPGIHTLHRVDTPRRGLRLEHAVQLGRAAPHLEHARQQAAGGEAARHAVLHDLPQAREPRLDLGQRPMCTFVGERQFVDLQAGVAAGSEQLRRAGIRIGHGHCLAGRSRLTGAQHGTPADRVHLLLEQGGAAGVAGRETHAVGVARQQLVAQEQQVHRLVEVDLMAAGQAQARLGPDAGDRGFHDRGVDRRRIVAFETEQDRPVRAMPGAGERERAVQAHVYRNRALEQARRLQA